MWLCSRSLVKQIMLVTREYGHRMQTSAAILFSHHTNIKFLFHWPSYSSLGRSPKETGEIDAVVHLQAKQNCKFDLVCTQATCWHESLQTDAERKELALILASAVTLTQQQQQQITRPCIAPISHARPSFVACKLVLISHPTEGRRLSWPDSAAAAAAVVNSCML